MRSIGFGGAGALCLLLVLGGCGDGGTADSSRGSGAPAVEIPSPELSAVEAPVATAIRAARAKVVDGPTRAAAWGGLGLVLHAHDFLSEALSCYRQAETLAPSDARWPYLAGRVLMGEDLERAREAFGRAVAIDPDFAAAHIYFGDLLLDLGEPEEADRQYSRALELAPGSPWALLGRARVAMAAGALDTARERLRKAIAAKPDFREAHSSLAQVARRLGDQEQAQIHMWAAANFTASSAPPDPVYQLVVDRGVSFRWATRRGVAYTDAGQLAEAEGEFRAALDIEPNDPATLGNLGGALAAQGRLDEAEEIYRRALEADADHTGAHINLAQALLQRGDLEAAAERLEQALEIDPLAPEAHLNLALLRARQERWDSSLEHGETAIRINPGDVRALGLVGGILAQRGDPEGAAELWGRAVRIDPRQLETLDRLARLLASQGQHREAVGWLRRGLETAPNSSRLLLFLAWELAVAPESGARSAEEALEMARRVRRGYPRMPQAADVEAAALAATGDFAGAQRQAELALELAESQGQSELAAAVRDRLRRYQNRRPYRLPE